MNETSESEASLTFSPKDVESTLGARWSRAAEYWSQNTALVGRNTSYSFGELYRRTSMLAAEILDQTPAALGCVALLVGQDTDMVLGAMAVISSGKALLGLHPGQPDAALSEILQDARPQLLLYQADLQDRAIRLAEGLGCPTLSLSLKNGSGETPKRPATKSTDPCTILYTSGSTGRPKGVVKSHRAILHRVWLGLQHDRIAPGDRASLLTHVGFASAEADIFATLLLGGCVCVFDAAELGLPAMKRWLNEERITLFHPPVVLFRHFLRTLNRHEQFPHVRLVALAGDVVVPSDLSLWKQHFSPQCELRHRFSSTETALLSVAHYREAQTVVHCGPSVDGKNLRIWADDPQQQDDGVGEIVVSSHYLASGYWNRPQETDQAFRVCQETGIPLYQTGDLGYFDEQNNLHFVGRRDDLVKIRGFRLSCREVEAALLQLGEVAEAAVTVDRAGGEAGLQAWVSLREAEEISVAQLHQKLSQNLPEWKIPARIILQQRLPKTITGKVDKVSIQQIEARRNTSTILRQLEELWLSLERSPVSSQDDLLLHGGDSITIVLLLHEIEREFGVEITPREFFVKRSLAHLVDLISQRHPERFLPPQRISSEDDTPGDSIDSVADAFLSLLNTFSVKHIFLNPGTDSAPLLESFIKFQSRGLPTPKLVLCLHESVAMSCAHGYFMVALEPQMVFVHVDLGTQNVGGSLHNAQRGRAGIVLVAGRSPYTLEGQTASRDRYAHWIQEQRDQTGVVRNYVKWDYTLPCPENLSLALERAFHIAAASPPGPVYLILPREVFMAPVSSPPVRSRETRRSAKAPDTKSIRRLATMILRAESPLLLTSRSGSDPHTVPALIELCELAGLPVVETRHRLNFPHTHPLHLGFSPNQFLPEADLVIVLDHEVPWIPAQWSPSPGCQIVQVDPDTEKTSVPIWGFPIDLSLEADPLSLLPALADEIRSRMTSGLAKKIEQRQKRYAETHRRLRESWADFARARKNERPIAPSWFGHCLNNVVDDETLVVCDAATNNPILWRHLQMDRPGSFFQSSGSSLGWGLGAAVGAKLAAPERQVIAVVGDGCWMFANPLVAYQLSEQEGAPFLTIVLNNEKYAAISEAVQSIAPEGEARRSRSFPACKLPTPGYYGRIAQAAGLWSQTVLKPDDLQEALRLGLKHVRSGGSALVEVWISSPNP
jgi:acetolactate synthase I/II/III large subunit